MAKAMDMSKFRKSITKAIDGISAGFHDPTTWISTGNYALNYLISGSFDKGVPLGKFSLFSGSSGAGKSYLVSGNIVKDAQAQGMFCILLDTENALDESWLHALGVDTSEEKLLKLNVTLISDAAKIINDFIKEYKEQLPEDRQKILIVIDSIGMMQSTISATQYADSVLKGDFGSKPKELMALMRGCMNQIAECDIAVVATNHSYASQDPYSPDDKISGGCLVENTKVKMEDGVYKNIQDIRVGDRVETLTGYNQVLTTWEFDKTTYSLELSNGNTIRCSPDHMFLIQRNEIQMWLSAESLVDGDTFVSKND